MIRASSKPTCIFSAGRGTRQSASGRGAWLRCLARCDPCLRGGAAERQAAAGAGVDYAILPEPVTRHHLDQIIPDRPFAMSPPISYDVGEHQGAEQAGLLHGRNWDRATRS